jgi:hypothetical protein
MMTAIYSAFTAQAYRRVNSEDGAYDTCIGYNVFVKLPVVAGIVETYVFVGRGGQGKGAEVFDGDDADALVARIIQAGSADLASEFDHVESVNVDELPDYVTNPHRPEYN